MKALVYMFRQDDPFKCTAAKLVKFRLAQRVTLVPRDCIVLDPFSNIPISKKDSTVASSVCAIDCSWERANQVLEEYLYERVAKYGIGRRLPAMLAANPVNYSKIGKLSSAEALAGSFYIMGDKEKARELMDKFKWGHTFLDLNVNLLQDYSHAETGDQILQVEQEYFPEIQFI